MSCSCGCNNLVIMLALLCKLSLIFFFFAAEKPMVVAARVLEVEEEEAVRQPFEMSVSREEMVELAGYGEEKLSTVLVTGSVICEARLHGDDIHAWPLSGASVAVKCQAEGKESKFWRVHGMTDDNGDFFIDIPSELHAMPDLSEKCSVILVRIPKNSGCQPASVRKHKQIRLSSVGNGIRTYEAGSIRLLPSATKPNGSMCDESVQKQRKINAERSLS